MNHKSKLVGTNPSIQTFFLVWFVVLSSSMTTLTFLFEMTPKTQDVAIFCTCIGWILMVTSIQKDSS